MQREICMYCGEKATHLDEFEAPCCDKCREEIQSKVDELSAEIEKEFNQK